MSEREGERERERERLQVGFEKQEECENNVETVVFFLLCAHSQE